MQHNTITKLVLTFSVSKNVVVKIYCIKLTRAYLAIMTVIYTLKVSLKLIITTKSREKRLLPYKKSIEIKHIHEHTLYISKKETLQRKILFYTFTLFTLNVFGAYIGVFLRNSFETEVALVCSDVSTLLHN